MLVYLNTEGTFLLELRQSCRLYVQTVANRVIITDNV